MATNEVLFDEISGPDGNIGIITLNRPQVLNSLNLSMIYAMHQRLKLWAYSSSIKAVVIRAVEGRAFCAGGDLRSNYERYKKKDPDLAEFFRDEYQLNRLIFHFPKPYIALLDGITMGGGVGISIHGSHRIGTDKLLFAMPETGIGFFPDVGGTYFLPRLPGYTGFYLGLLGARLNCDDCIGLGLAQHKVVSEKLEELIKALADSVFGDDPRASVTEIVKLFSVVSQSSTLLKQQTLIDEIFSLATMEEIVTKLQSHADAFCQVSSEQIVKKSPTSLKVTLEALHRGKNLDFDACMDQEYRLAHHLSLGHDFIEGIRALIIDKDQNPQWRPSSLKEVSNERVNEYFK